jgi:hypothetical protein
MQKTSTADKHCSLQVHSGCRHHRGDVKLDRIMLNSWYINTERNAQTLPVANGKVTLVRYEYS